jgi:hypothetical protein
MPDKEEQTESQICIITERVTPLAVHKAAQELQQETLKWGLHTIAVRDFPSFEVTRRC